MYSDLKAIQRTWTY